ncbi:MAG: L,D-transpeptidase, partial [Deltaproteobacteria bacterium]
MNRRIQIIFGVVIGLLVAVNAFVFYLYFVSNQQNKALLETLSNTNKEVMHIKELICAGSISEATRNTTTTIAKLNATLSIYSPAKQLVASTSNKTEVVTTTQSSSSETRNKALTIGANESPTALVKGKAGEYALVVEKENKQLHLFLFNKDKVVLIKSYQCVVGENANDKKKEGDLATPVGVYFLIGHHADEQLPELYGAGAFVLNYPSLFDYKIGKKGNGIWLHGHPRDKKIGRDKISTKGCVAVDNNDLKELSTKIKLGRTPIIITNKINLVNDAENN